LVNTFSGGRAGLFPLFFLAGVTRILSRNPGLKTSSDQGSGDSCFKFLKNDLLRKESDFSFLNFWIMDAKGLKEKTACKQSKRYFFVLETRGVYL